MTSRVPNLGPYGFPDVVALKEWPSSPWYAHDFGSHPGILVRATFGPVKPTPIILPRHCQHCAGRGSSEQDLPILALGNNCDLVVVDAALPGHGVVRAHRGGLVIRPLIPAVFGHPAVLVKLQMRVLVRFAPLRWPGRGGAVEGQIGRASCRERVF